MQNHDVMPPPMMCASKHAAINLSRPKNKITHSSNECNLIYIFRMPTHCFHLPQGCVYKKPSSYNYILALSPSILKENIIEDVRYTKHAFYTSNTRTVIIFPQVQNMEYTLFYILLNVFKAITKLCNILKFDLDIAITLH